MNQQELHELLEELEGMLREVGLMSVVEQEQQAAAEGRSVEEQGGRRGESGVQIAALSLEDRVAMLLDLIEVAVGGTQVISSHLSAWAGEEFIGADVEHLVEFSPSLAEGLRPEDSESWALPDGEILAQRHQKVQGVLDTVAEIREVVGLERTGELAPRPSLYWQAREVGWA